MERTRCACVNSMRERERKERITKYLHGENYVKIELFTTRIRLNCQNVSAFIYKDCLTIDLRGRRAK